jgi:DNA-binding GntR family transcriptional regulator
MSTLADEPTPEFDVANAICQSISEAIVEDQLPPGTKLPKAAIGTHFGVSRTVVRSTMNRLNRERFVDMRKNRGCSLRLRPSRRP